ncbi:AraC family transcriptional regulator [Oleiphilus messinensis]|uniref:AraC family transcriptional regulator n=1 Tax=Oleiphilus messinensis TaxID=141451 RepID=A0A1Y0ICN9_9GAMM|nr:AraC family transcriptional regulator [Oleiphilus messinensis]ARU58287.1 AraC family transcriptional regulator [Oleiphilus messinensis]
MTLTRTTPRKRYRLGDIALNHVYVLLRILENLGLDFRPTLESYQIEMHHFGVHNARISIPKYMRIGRAAIELSDNELIGLLSGAHTQTTDLGMPGLAANSANSLAEALETLVKLEPLGSKNCRGQSSYVRGRTLKETNRVRFYSISPYNKFNYFVVDSVLSTWFCFAKRLSPNFQLAEVNIEYADRGFKTDFENFFQCPVNFSAEQNELVIRAKHYHLKNPFHQPATFQHTLELCEKELKQLQSNSSITECVTEKIGPRLNHSPPSIEEIGQQLGLSPWTLRRRLVNEGTSFSEILDNTRMELAQSYTRDTFLSFSEISYLLGFSSPAAFQRAFKRWFEQSPGEYRKAHSNHIAH